MRPPATMVCGQRPSSPATIDTFYGACQEMSHREPFVMDADEAPVLLGEDNGANPVEFVLAGLSGCMTTTLANPVKIKIEVEKV